MAKPPAWWLFWGALGAAAYTYVAFPALVAVRAWWRPRPVRAAPITPRLSMIIAAYNEADVITAKLDNIVAQDYPRDRLEIIVASDGSTDATAELAAAYRAVPVRVLRLPRQGKNATLNAAVAAASGEILVFSDADVMLAPDALRRLVAAFADAEVGAVGGDQRYRTQHGENSGERAYWDVDRWLKLLQSRAGSMTSAHGALYAIRRELFRPLPPGVTDDFFISVQAVAAGRRLIFEPRALAYTPVAASSRLEFRRKVRVISAGLRGVWSVRGLLDPRRYGFYALQLLSHKVLRRLMAIPVLCLAVSAPGLWRQGGIYRLAALAQLVLHGAAGLGFLGQGTRWGRAKVLALPLFFDLVNVAALVALWELARGRRHDLWTPQRVPSADAPARLPVEV